MSLEGAPDAIEDHRPASKLVYWALLEEGPLSISELAEATRLSQRVARQEARRLEDDDLVETTPRPSDPRGVLYDTV